MRRKSGFTLLALVAVLSRVGAAIAADTKPTVSKDEAKACERSCGDPRQTEAEKYERCMLNCPMPAPDDGKRKHKNHQSH
jgi:hypothetical protein